MRVFGIHQGLIARRLFVQILMLSLMAAVIISIVQLHFRYRDKLRCIDVEIQRIETSHLNSMAAHLWLMDETLLRTELEGIMNLPNIRFVEVCGNEGQRIALGAPGMSNRIEREYPLVFSHRGIETEIGQFRIQVNLNWIWTELLEDAAALSLGEAGKIFVIAFLVFILFQISVGRHLQSLALQARTLDLGRPHSPFNLDRTSRQGKAADELEYLVSALNGLNAHLMGTIENLRQTNENLDQEIVERQKAESVSHERELRLRLLTDNMVDAISQVDAQRLVCYCSPSVERVFGIKCEDLIGHNAYERVHPEDIERLRQQALEAIASHAASLRNEYRYLHGSGEYVWVESSVRLLYGESGDYDGAIIGSRDITGRKRAEDALRQANLVVENSPVVVFRWKAAEGWPVEMVSKNVSQFGYTQEELLSGAVPFELMVHPEDLVRVGREVREYSASGTDRFQQEYRMITRNGGVHWVDDRTMVERNAYGQIVFYQGIIIDITERKRTEAALRESEERLRLALLAANQGLYDLNLQTGDAVVDPEYACMLGYDPDTFRETNAAWRDRLHPDDREQVYRVFQDYIEGRRGDYRVEFRQLTSSGDWKWILSLGSIVERDKDGEPLRMLGTHTDITEIKHIEAERFDMERRLLHAQKLESLGVLAGGIAHDFNNLLMAILGYADLALLDVSPVSPVRPSLQEIIKASHRAADLCRQMLAYSGKGKFVIEHMNLSEVVQEMIHMLKTSISKKVLLNLNLEKIVPPIEGDPGQIRQVIMNLVINSSEAIGEKSGVVTVSIGARHCDAEYLRETFHDDALAEGLYVSLEVSDTGCGMDRETQARIFEPFFTTKFTGRGLGMSAVLGIVRGHKGALKVYSEPGKGTTFRVLFPASAQAGEALLEDAIEPGSEWRGTGTVLLVDDEEPILAVGRLMLERLGFSVITAWDGREAVEIYRTRGKEIAFVVLDLTMPRMNGEEAFRELRRIDPGVQVFISSGYSQWEISARFSGKSLAGFIQKPYQMAVLRDVLKGLLK